MSDCRSCSIVDDILAPTLEANFLVEKRILESLFYNSTSKASVIQARNMKKLEGELTIQEHSVSRNEASIFQHISTYFLPFFICIFIAMEIAMEMKHNRASDTFDVKLHNINNNIGNRPLRPTPQEKRNIFIHRLARVVPRHKKRSPRPLVYPVKNVKHLAKTKRNSKIYKQLK